MEIANLQENPKLIERIGEDMAGYGGGAVVAGFGTGFIETTLESNIPTVFSPENKWAFVLTEAGLAGASFYFSYKQEGFARKFIQGLGIGFTIKAIDNTLEWISGV